MKKKHILTGLTVVILGAIATAIWFSVRVERVRQTVHYHANIAFYINGERLDISDDKYMEDIGACSSGTLKSPRERVHFHEGNMDTVHVHDDGVTWGHLMSNLGFSFSQQAIILDGERIIGADENKRWSYVLNGVKILDPFNQHIRSTDRLLLTYGAETKEEVMQRFENVLKKRL